MALHRPPDVIRRSPHEGTLQSSPSKRRNVAHSFPSPRLQVPMSPQELPMDSPANSANPAAGNNASSASLGALPNEVGTPSPSSLNPTDEARFLPSFSNPSR